MRLTSRTDLTDFSSTLCFHGMVGYRRYHSNVFISPVGQVEQHAKDLDADKDRFDPCMNDDYNTNPADNLDLTNLAKSLSSTLQDS
eukprot:scaffold2335_cov175-Amphora_coffeaeformis.AAC.7